MWRQAASQFDAGICSSAAREVTERFVAVYAPGAVWGVHVPGWDGLLTDAADIRALHASFFGREEFRIDRYQLVAEGNTVALRWSLGWRDRKDGAPCVSFQSHFFEVADGLIRRHGMYCAGVRVVA